MVDEVSVELKDRGSGHQSFKFLTKCKDQQATNEVQEQTRDAGCDAAIVVP